MNSSLTLFSLVWSSLLLFACGEGATPFKEVELGRLNVEVDKGASGESDDPSSTFPVPSEAGTSDAAEPSQDEIVALAAAGIDDSETPKGDDAVTDSKGKKAQGAPNPDDGAGKNKDLADVCAKSFVGKAKTIRVVSSDYNGSKLMIDESTVIAAKITGNQPTFALNISGVEKIAGICLFISGNQPKITIDSAVSIGRLVYAATGNQSKGKISMIEQAELESSVIVLKGNKQSLELSGVSEAHCQAASISGNASVCR